MISVYTLKDSQKWEEIVRSFDRYDVYYLPGYAKAFEQNGDGTAVLLYFEKEHTRAINVILRRDIAEIPVFKPYVQPKQWFDYTTPYGYGGWLVEGNGFELLCKEYEQFAREQNVISEFVRFHPILQNWKGLNGFYEDVHLGQTIFLDTTSEDTIWSNFTSQNRGKIRKAQKNGLKVYWCHDERILDSFIEVYRETMDKDDATEYYYFDKNFFKSIFEDLNYNAMWFYAVKDDEVAAAGIFLFCNGQMHYHLSGSRRKFQTIAPVNLLLYEAALWAFANGYRTLHLGGGVGAKEDSLYVFKKSFNRYEDAQFHIGKKIFNQEKYDELVAIRANDNPTCVTSSYFPQYRA